MFHRTVHSCRCDSKSENPSLPTYLIFELSQIRGETYGELVTSPFSTHVMARPTPAEAGDVRREGLASLIAGPSLISKQPFLRRGRFCGVYECSPCVSYY